MKIVMVVFAAMFLSGCAARIAAVRDCRQEAGNEPNQWANSFGLVGSLINSTTPEMQAYNKTLNDCMLIRLTPKETRYE
jgi:PBP1b-binding outer membrane lipoprotein LpoB